MFLYIGYFELSMFIFKHVFNLFYIFQQLATQLNARKILVDGIMGCGTLKRVMWYFEEGGTLKRAVCTLKRVILFFEKGGVVL